MGKVWSLFCIKSDVPPLRDHYVSHASVQAKTKSWKLDLTKKEAHIVGGAYQCV